MICACFRVPLMSSQKIFTTLKNRSGNFRAARPVPPESPSLSVDRKSHISRGSVKARRFSRSSARSCEELFFSWLLVPSCGQRIESKRFSDRSEAGSVIQAEASERSPIRLRGCCLVFALSLHTPGARSCSLCDRSTLRVCVPRSHSLCGSCARSAVCRSSCSINSMHSVLLGSRQLSLFQIHRTH